VALLALGVASGVIYERFSSDHGPLMVMRADQSGVSASAPNIAKNQLGDTESTKQRPSSSSSNSASKVVQRAQEPRARRSGIENSAPRTLRAEREKIILDYESPQLPAFSDYQIENIPAWRRHSEQGQFAEALSELEASGGFDAAFVDAASEELMLLADIARFAGRRGRAIQALRLLTETYFLSPQAPMAALTLGHLLSAAGDPASAREAYALNRRLSPGGEFAEDALVREFSLAVEASSLNQAQTLFAQYQNNFPEGRQQDSLAEELARLQESLRQQAEVQEDSGALVEDEATDPGAAQQGQTLAVSDEADSNEGDSSNVEAIAPESAASESKAPEFRASEPKADSPPRAEPDLAENNSEKDGTSDTSAEESSAAKKVVPKAATPEAPTPDNRSDSAP
jgi:hypothetical protein